MGFEPEEEEDMLEIGFEEGGSIGTLASLNRVLSMPEHIGSRYVQAAADLEVGDNKVSRRPYFDMTMPLGAHMKSVDGGSRFRMDTERCLRMFVLAGLAGEPTRYRSYPEAEEVVADGSQT
ncbi:hypothetical protein CCMA1212_010484 [Trichoderma ghanense]|uniref:Uncharacterized protein n=1 Tax=Trichoderma ghanense TaxID=65468 RepID=A0ABY2GQB4_9HYPO